MSLILYYHPLSSFCWKVLIPLYENGTAFTHRFVDPNERSELTALWPMVKLPVLRDEAKRRTVPESTTIIEYLDLHYPGPVKMIPSDPDEALQVRLRDRFFDNYIMTPMFMTVGNRIRPADKKDAYGAAQYRATLQTALDLLEKKIEGLTWAMGDAYTMADASAAPSLFYANKIIPFADSHPHTMAYLNRLMARPAFARVLKEAEPVMHMFPTE